MVIPTIKAKRLRPFLDQKLPGNASPLLQQQGPFEDAAFEQLFKENFSGLCLYCQHKFGFDLDVAKEAVNIGFIKLWESRLSICPGLSVPAYLYKIVTNVCFDQIKHARVKQRYEHQLLKSEILTYNKQNFDKAEFHELETTINRAIAELPEQMRRIFEMSRYDGLKYNEISAHLNISIKTVETQMSRALVKLRLKLADYLPV